MIILYRYSLGNGKLLITPNHCYMGSSKVDLAADTKYVHPAAKQCNYVYTHPTSKQCNYSYTHPSAKQCSWEPGPEANWKLITSCSQTFNWTHDDPNLASENFIYKEYPINQIVGNYSQIKFVTKRFYIGKIEVYRTNYGPYTYAVSYRIDGDDFEIFGISKASTRANVISNQTITASNEYSKLTTQLPWQYTQDGAVIKLTGFNNYSPSWSVVENVTSLRVGVSGSGSNSISNSTGTNVQIEVEIYGANY